jgi:Ankyrin repeats (many copies)
VARNDVVVVRALLDKGADSYCDNWALSYSISGRVSNRAIIESLTRFKRDIRTSNLRDDTILIEARQHNNPEAIRALLSLGADIDAQSNYGFTTLNYAPTGIAMNAWLCCQNFMQIAHCKRTVGIIYYTLRQKIAIYAHWGYWAKRKCFLGQRRLNALGLRLNMLIGWDTRAVHVIGHVTVRGPSSP